MAGVRETWLPAEPASAGAARRFVRDAGQALALEPHEIDDLTMATSEAVTNAIQHGRPCDDHGLRLRVEGRRDRVTVEICDCGIFAGVLPVSPPALPDPDSIRGRGLPIIEALADEVELVPGDDTTLVRFSKRRNGGEPAAGRPIA